jgi:hypothetical protein
MLNLISLALGIIGLFWVALAFIPLLGWANWLILPFAIIGLGLGAISGKRTGRNLNIIVILVGLSRLALGGGIF